MRRCQAWTAFYSSVVAMEMHPGNRKLSLLSMESCAKLADAMMFHYDERFKEDGDERLRTDVGAAFASARADYGSDEAGAGGGEGGCGDARISGRGGEGACGDARISSRGCFDCEGA